VQTQNCPLRKPAIEPLRAPSEIDSSNPRGRAQDQKIRSTKKSAKYAMPNTTTTKAKNNATTTATLPMMLSGHHFLFVAKAPSRCQLGRQRTRGKGASMNDSQAANSRRLGDRGRRDVSDLRRHPGGFEGVGRFMKPGTAHDLAVAQSPEGRLVGIAYAVSR
jgi:hypothetical protein